MDRASRIVGYGVTVVLFAISAYDATATPPVRRALVIAYNGTDDLALNALRYADDDGVLWSGALRRLGVETTLLVEPDAETLELGDPILKQAALPTPEALSSAVRLIRSANERDRAAGLETDTLVVYVGHGNTDESGRPYLTLRGGRLDRTSLYEKVVDQLGADYVHIIVDACRASGVIGSRGKENSEIVEQLRAVLEREQLAVRPSVGVAYAESEDGETHEWSRIRSGVFSHVVRSGLLGAADINHDGLVEYSELEAFVAASIRAVKGIPSRLTVHAIPPARQPHRALIGPAARGPALKLPADFEHPRLSIEDNDGSRLIDVHRSVGESLLLSLPYRPAYWLRTPTHEALVALADLGKTPQFRPRELAQRGPAAEALRRGLFAVAFDRRFYQSYVSSTGLVSVSFSPTSGAADGTASVETAAPETLGGLELGATLAKSPLGMQGWSVGPVAAWRRPTPIWYGLRGSYTFTPEPVAGNHFHRVSFEGIAGLQSTGLGGFFGEMGAGWALIGLVAPGVREGDPLTLTAHATGGLLARIAGIPSRLGGLIGADWVRVNGKHQLNFFPGVELLVTFGNTTKK